MNQVGFTVAIAVVAAGLTTAVLSVFLRGEGKPEAREEVARLERRVAALESSLTRQAQFTRPRGAERRSRPASDAATDKAARGGSDAPGVPSAVPRVGGSEGAAGETAHEERLRGAERDLERAERRQELALKTVSRVDEMKRKYKIVKLRMLPEDQRWTKAVEGLSLTSSQRDELRFLIGSRDRAYTSALEERRIATDAGNRVEREVDADALGKADEVFQTEVRTLLDSDQRVRWFTDGYDGSFGRRRPVAGVTEPSAN